MNFFRVQSALIAGLQATPVRVECAQARRLPYLQILGGSGSAVNEMRERVMSALQTLAREKFRLPARRFTVEITPSLHSLPIETLDLAVAVAILGSCGQFPASRTEKLLICGRLGLDGGISLPKGVWACRRLLRSGVFESALLPLDASDALEERHLERGGGFSHLEEVVDFLRGTAFGVRSRREKEVEALPAMRSWSRVPGQELAKRVIEISAAGSHHLLLAGAQGARADLLAHALSSLLPPLAEREAEEVREIYALAGLEHAVPARPIHFFGSCPALPPLLHDRKLALVEESLLAHRGVLYVDQVCDREAALFPALLPLMRSGLLPSHFLGRTALIPAEAVVVASASACACGGAGDPLTTCSCRPTEARRYRARWRGLLRQPFDLFLPIFPERGRTGEESSEAGGEVAAERVAGARIRMKERGFGWNARLPEENLFTAAPWAPKARRLWETLEARAGGQREEYLSVARVALTIADLSGTGQVGEAELLEALHYLPSAGVAAGGAVSGSARSASIPAVNSSAIPKVRSP
jgi:magnesium chelatase family protein